MKSIPIHSSQEKFNVGKIFCVGKNYAEHIKEMQSEIPASPVIFLKPTTALIANGETIVAPLISRQVHHEVELVVAIGKGGKFIAEHEAEEHIYGYAVGLDMTLRDVQSEAKKKGLPWAIAKGFDTSAPVSEIFPKEVFANKQIEIVCRVNGVERQRVFCSEMMYPPTRIITYLSTIFTLEAGDLIFTGTPQGVGEVHHNDVIEAELTGYTTLHHPIYFQ